MQFIVLSVLLSIMQATPPVPWDTPNPASQKTHTDKKTPTASPSPIPQVSAPTPETNRTDNASSQNTKQPIMIGKLPPISVEKDWMDRTAWFFGLILLFVGVLGVCAAVRTLRAIETQSGHLSGQLTAMRSQLAVMQDQLAAQKADLKQWVVVDNWETEDETTEPWGYSIGTDASGVEHVSGAPNTLPIKVIYQVGNESSKPLTMTGVETSLQVEGRPEWQKFTGDERFLIPPKGNYPLHVRLVLVGKEVAKYVLDELHISTDVKVFYEDVLGNKQTPSFSGILNAGIKHTHVLRYVGKSQTEQKSGQNPN